MKTLFTVGGMMVAFCLAVALGTAWGDGTGEVAVEEEISSSATEGEWSLSVEDDTASASSEGSISLEGGKLIAGSIGDIEWEQSGTNLFGTLRSKEGTDVAYFTATLGGSGPLTGTFTTVGGEEGTWTWNGPIPTP